MVAGAAVGRTGLALISVVYTAVRIRIRRISHLSEAGRTLIFA